MRVLRDTTIGGVGHNPPQQMNANFGGSGFLGVLLTLDERTVVCPVLIPKTWHMGHGSEYCELRKLYD